MIALYIYLVFMDDIFYPLCRAFLVVYTIYELLKNIKTDC